MKLEILVIADAILRAEALSSLLATCPDFTVTARSFEAQRPSGTWGLEPSVVVCDTTDASMSAPEKNQAISPRKARSSDHCRDSRRRRSHRGVLRFRSSRCRAMGFHREINSSYCFEGLTAREKSIVSLLLLGMTNQMVGDVGS